MLSGGALPTQGSYYTPRPVLTADQGYTGLPGHQDPLPRHPGLLNAVRRSSAYSRFVLPPPPAPYSRLTKVTLDYWATKIPVPHVTPGLLNAVRRSSAYSRFVLTPPPHSRLTKVTLDYWATKIPPRHPRAVQRRPDELCLFKVRITPTPIPGHLDAHPHPAAQCSQE